jgi:hypothetical protein
MRFVKNSPLITPSIFLITSATVIMAIFLTFRPAYGVFNDYNVNKPSAFRDYQQVMIWDSEIYDAIEGLAGTLMFSTGSCFSGGFIDDLIKLDHAAVVTANTWHGFGMSIYDFIPGQTDARSFSDDYMNAFAWDGQGDPPTFENAYVTARDTIHQTDGYNWYWGGVEFPQLGVSGNAADCDLVYQAGDRAILFSGMWPGNEYFLSSWDYTIANGRSLLMQDYGWPAEAVITLFHEGRAPSERPVSWQPSGAGTKANLLAAMREAADTLEPDNKLVVFAIAHGRSSAIMTSRLSADNQTIEYLLIPNGRNIAPDGNIYPAANYGSTRLEITELRDLEPSHYTVSLPDSLPNWIWRIDPDARSLFIEAENPLDQENWLTPGAEYVIQVQYHRKLTDNELGRGGWNLWLPLGGGGPLFKSDAGWPGNEPWGMGEHVPGGQALGSPDPAGWGHGWETGGDGWILVPAPAQYGESSCLIGTLMP